MYKEESMHRFDGSCSSSTDNYCLFGQMTGTPPAIPGMSPMTAGQSGTLPIMPVQAMTQQATRNSRSAYVRGFSQTTNEQSVATFFSQAMSSIGGNTAGPGDAVVNVYMNHEYMNHEKKFAFVEMRSVEEASNATAMDGIIFEGAPVKVRRLSDYNPSLAAALGPILPKPNLNLAAVGLTPRSVGGLEGPDCLFVGGLPYDVTEALIRDWLEPFGPLRGLELVKDWETGNLKPYAFFAFQDPWITDLACATLNRIKMRGKTLTVRRANPSAQPRPKQENILLQAQQQATLQRLLFEVGSLPTKVICLTQVVSADKLKDHEYEDILEDMIGESGKYGALVNVVRARPNPNGESSSGVGKVFLEYANTDGSSNARAGLNEGKFGGNHVVAVFYPEDKFSQGYYGAPVF